VAYLNDPSNSHIILVIDEIDFLINKSKNLLYNIFNWTTYEGSKLIVISISNTLDLPNKLSQKIKSRMGNNKIMFKPYNKDELITILKSKGVEYEKFTQDALRLSCMKVAAINGDLRRIIQILQRAKEIYKLSRKKNKDGKIDKNFIIKACDDLFNSKFTKVMESLQISEKIIICAVLSKYKDVNENKVKVGDLYDKKDIFIKKYNESSDKDFEMTWEEYKKIIYNLMRIKLLNYGEIPKSNFIENNIVIRFYIDEFTMACERDDEFKPVMDYLTQLVNI
jgi:Cdc6-like AAA superfamily ATPase